MKQANARLAFALLVVGVIFGAFPLLSGIYIWIDGHRPAADPFPIRSVGEPWVIGSERNQYEVIFNKHRDCRFEVFHVWNGEHLPAPAARPVRIGARVFNAHARPPDWLTPGTATFTAYVRYWCNPLVPQIVKAIRPIQVRLVEAGR